MDEIENARKKLEMFVDELPKQKIDDTVQMLVG